ncbi:tyrosine-type recombinase/integrase [uncultured Nostoc sp.]|uniref:tyrosine-type recombinase/integrase n=1 Tax=uncultured Nostoc sp. TaxID=340711 RepID=UPI0035CC5081
MKLVFKKRWFVSPFGEVKSQKSLVLSVAEVKVKSNTFRHSFATNLLQSGYDIHTIQELFRHKYVKTRMIYTLALNRGGKAVRSLLD